MPYFSAGGARVRLSGTAAHFDRAAADLEGFARPLWGLAPLAAGGAKLDCWELYRTGLAHGTDPGHPEYWGTIKGTDQRLVELAAIGFAMRLIPELIWDPLDEAAKANVAAYLLHARKFDYANNNWKFFRVLVDLGLERCGVAFDGSLTEQYLDELDGFYLGDGWYRDGINRRIDHYIPFAMHYYGLIYAQLSGDEVRAAAYRERAKVFATDIGSWFDEDGGVLAFGRSLAYRFACGGIWGALAYAGVEALPWGEIKGHYLRHLRWWSKLPIADRDGVLSVGYGYPNLLDERELQFSRIAVLGLQGILATGAAGGPSLLDGRGVAGCSRRAGAPPAASGHGNDADTRQCGRPFFRSTKLGDAVRGGEVRQVRVLIAIRLLGGSRRAGVRAGGVRRHARAFGRQTPLPGARGERSGADCRHDTVQPLAPLARCDGGDLAGRCESLACPRPQDHDAAAAREFGGRVCGGAGRWEC